MKKLFSLTLILILLLSFTGCRTLYQAEEYIDHKLDVAENQVEQAIQDAVTPAPQMVSPSAPPEAPQQQDPTVADQGITEAQAQAIALEHAGVTEQDVSRLHTRTDFDDGRQEYDVEFHVDYLEYEYEIDAATGRILSFDKDA